MTLFDFLFQATFCGEPFMGIRDAIVLRRALRDARRFVLDDGMSSFLGELSTQAFVKPHLTPEVVHRMAEHLRYGARLPFETTWIEYDLRAALRRSHALINATRQHDPSKVRDERLRAYDTHVQNFLAYGEKAIPQSEGWLLQQHPKIDTAIMVQIFAHHPEVPAKVYLVMPAFVWTVDDGVRIPWHILGDDGPSGQPTRSEMATGLPGYITKNIGICPAPLLDMSLLYKGGEEEIAGEDFIRMTSDWSGVLRRIFALLATINDLPVHYAEVRPTKGFMIDRTYHKFLHHKTITLTVPQQEFRRLARTVLALAHRRAHGVRGHWRKDWRRPLSSTCEHEFSADEKHLTCKRCDGRKIWVEPYQRGDSSIGLVTHDYSVEHGKHE